MGEITKQTQQRTPPEVRKQRDLLFELDFIDAARRANGKNFHEASQTVASIETALRSMEGKYAQFPHYKWTVEIFKDLSGDLRQNRPLDIDTSSSKILSELQRRPRLVRLLPEQLPPGNTRNLVNKYQQFAIFKRKDVKIDYVVVSAQDAPTATLLLQDHSADPSGTSSQNKIMEIASDAAKGSLLDAVHPEGQSFGNKLSIGEATRSTNIRRLLLTYPELKLDGADDEGLRAIDLGESILFLQEKQPHRANLNDIGLLFRNIFIANNMAEIAEERRYAHVLCDIGISHEVNTDNPPDGRFFGNQQHPLPLSELLAREGFNVLVINTTDTPIDPRKG